MLRNSRIELELLVVVMLSSSQVASANALESSDLLS